MPGAEVPVDRFGYLLDFDGQPYVSLTNVRLGLTARLSWDAAAIPYGGLTTMLGAMSLPNTGSQSSPLATMKPMIFSFLTAPILLTVVVWFAITEMTEPPIWSVVAALALVVGGFLVAETVGYSAPALDSDLDRDEAKARAVAIWRAKLMVRFAVTEAPILIGLTLAFVAQTRWPFLIALVAGWPSLAYQIMPHRRSIEKLQSNLDKEGASSFLDEALRSPN